SGMVATRLGSVTWVACASPAYLAARGEPRTPDALLDHDCILFERWFHESRWAFGRGAARREITLRSCFAVNSADAAISAAVAGAGIARVLSYQVHAAAEAGALRLILRPFEAEPLPVHIVHGGQSQMALKLRAFLDFATPRLRASIPALPAVAAADL